MLAFQVFQDGAVVPGWEGKIVAWVEEDQKTRDRHYKPQLFPLDQEATENTSDAIRKNSVTTQNWDQWS